MVVIQDTGCVTHYGIGGPDTSGGTPLPRAGETLDSARPYGGTLHPSVAKKTQHSKLNKKSQNLIDADSGLTHVSESSLQVSA